MRRRILTALLSVVLLAMSGCTKGKEGNDKRVVIRFTTFEGPMRRAADAFMEKNPEIRVRFEPITEGSFFDKLIVQFAGDAGPDIFFMSEQFMRSFITKGIIQDLELFIEKDKEFKFDDYYPFVRETYSYAGKVYGLSPGFSPMVLFYNKRMFDEEGVGYPDEEWTWDDFLKAAIKLTKRDDRQMTVQYGAAMPRGRDGLVLLFRFGKNVFNEDGTKCIINNEEAKKAFVFLHDLVKKHQVIPTPQSLETVGITQLFKMERASMLFAGRWMVREFKKCKDLDFHVALFPKDDRGVRAVPLFTGAYCISAMSRQKESAWKFLKFLAGYEGQKISMEYDYVVPTLKLLAESEDFLSDPNFPNPNENRIFLDSMKSAYVLQYSDYIPDSRLSALVDLGFEKYLLGQQEVEDSLANIEKEVNKVIGENILKEK